MKGETDRYYDYAPGNHRKELWSELGIDGDLVVGISEQIHSVNVARVDDARCRYTKLDGLVTNRRDIFLTTLVADCIALLIYDPKNHAVANLHSGWRGTLAKMARVGVQKMIDEYGSRPEDLICVICPSIRRDDFEVEREVKDDFARQFREIADEIIEEVDGHKFMIDTVACNKYMLEEMGLRQKNIIDTGICTVCANDVLHSYRANKDTEKARRNLALIGLKSC